jgi:hypothetical protein
VTELRERPEDQPLPTPGRDCVQDALIAAIEDRKALGIKRYGSPLMSHNGRDALRDAWEESIDLAAYLTQLRMERYDVRAERDRYREGIEKALAWMPQTTLTAAMAPDGVAGAVNTARDILRAAVGQ